MKSARTLCTLALLSTGAFAQSIVLPGGLAVPSPISGGAGFTYSGTLTQNATIALDVTGLSCEQAGSVYCTNAAGVVAFAGSSPVGAATSFFGNVGGFNGTWNYGALIMSISGVGSVQLFPANSAHGLGSNPSGSLSLPPTSLSALGFSNFSVSNPSIRFTVADNLYTDNSGAFFLTIGSGLPSPTPAPGTLVLVILGMAALTAAFWADRLRRSRV